MNYKELASSNSTFNEGFVGFLKFHKSQYMRKILLKDITLEKSKNLENSIFSIKGEIGEIEESSSITIKSLISDLFS